MNPRRRTLVAALGLLPLAGYAQPRLPAPGVDYSELKPRQPVEAQGKIEVLEFFWYGCPHCYTLEPLLEKWVARLPADVQFRPVPAVLNEGWAREAAVYYSFEALGVLERLHRPFFDAIHRDRLNTRDPEKLADWLRKQDVDPKRYEEAFKSFGVQSKVRRAMQLSAAYRIDGTPALAVQGRYTVSAEQGRTQQGMLDTVDYLIGLARKGGQASG
ncbi:MAG: thiol:disulfide interchange protein DsbA/DsbL [Burkholderiales bacterium]